MALSSSMILVTGLTWPSAVFDVVVVLRWKYLVRVSFALCLQVSDSAYILFSSFYFFFHFL
jgi:hypothetical protein